MPRRLHKPTSRTTLPATYPAFLTDLKSRIRTAQVKAALSVNRELIALYWHIGKSIVERQVTEGWGKAIVDRLAKDLQREFPGVGGYSAGNIRRMRGFYLAWVQETEGLPHPDSELSGPISAQAARELASPNSTRSARKSCNPIVPQSVGQIRQQPAAGLHSAVVSRPAQQGETSVVPQAVAELPWGHNILLLEKLKNPATRLWYAHQTTLHGWSRNILALQIASKLHARQGKAVNNFPATLPPRQSDLAQQVLKDPYIFDFLTLGPKTLERALESDLVNHITRFLLELGAGFAFVGRQFHLEVDGDDYYLDLLFYHVKLHCYIVLDLKTGPFKPEDAGKMNFYLSAVDDQLRSPQDKPTLGLILCRDKKRLTAEYALRRIAQPIGVARWQSGLTDKLPKQLQRRLPTIQQLQKALSSSPHS